MGIRSFPSLIEVMPSPGRRGPRYGKEICRARLQFRKQRSACVVTDNSQLLGNGQDFIDFNSSWHILKSLTIATISYTR